MIIKIYLKIMSGTPFIGSEWGRLHTYVGQFLNLSYENF